MISASEKQFNRNYETLRKHLRLKDLRPKTIEAYTRAIRRIGGYFNYRIGDLSEAQLIDYFTELLHTHSWSARHWRGSFGPRCWRRWLGRYLYRGVVKEKDILACKDGQVTFRYQQSKTRQMQTRTLPGVEFLWLLLRHVLPKRLRRARNLGFPYPNSKRLIQLLQVLCKINPSNASTWLKQRPALTCPHCGGVITIIRTRIPPPRSRRERLPTTATGAPVM